MLSSPRLDSEWYGRIAYRARARPYSIYFSAESPPLHKPQVYHESVCCIYSCECHLFILVLIKALSSTSQWLVDENTSHLQCVTSMYSSRHYDTYMHTQLCVRTSVLFVRYLARSLSCFMTAMRSLEAGCENRRDAALCEQFNTSAFR